MSTVAKPRLAFRGAIFTVGAAYAVASAFLYSIYNAFGLYFGVLWLDQAWGFLLIGTPIVAAVAAYLGARDQGASSLSLAIWSLLAIMAVLQVKSLINGFGYREHGPNIPLTLENWFAWHGATPFMYAFPVLGLLLSLTAKMHAAREATP